MYFLTPPDLAPTVLAKLSNAGDVRLAVAYFNPDHELLAALRKIPRLRLIDTLTTDPHFAEAGFRVLLSSK